jgi:ubiquinone/menaquinone biosynthesis C-methylase UbiE
MKLENSACMRRFDGCSLRWDKDDAFMSNIAVPLEKVKDSMRTMWMAGDFGVIAKLNSPVAEEFVKRLALPAGARVLDVATGTGNLAIPLAQSGAVVTGIDIATNLLAQARERAAAEGLTVQFDEGDAEQMPYADGAFDATVTMFGAMFAPRPEIVAAELARVLKPGGMLAMANWNPNSFTGKMFRIGSKHAPPPHGLPAPVMWGDETTVRERLTPYFAEIKTELIPIELDKPMSPGEIVDFYRKYFGPTQMAFSRLDEASGAAMAAELVALFTEFNVADDPAERTLVHGEYLQVTAIRKSTDSVR